MIEQTELHYKFVASVEQASTNALIIFGIALCLVLAYRALEFLPEKFRPFVKLGAWCYAILVLGITIAASV